METVKTALITGASSGIGYELARLFSIDKYNLVIVGRDENILEDIAEELTLLGSPSITVIHKDLSITGAAAEVYEETRDKGITVDILVNDAGAGVHGFFAETDIERELGIIQLNISTLVHLTKLYLSDMLAVRRGRILQVASIAAYQPTPLLAVYSASKAFVLSFTDSLINELKDTGVTMTALIPGATDTDFFINADAEHTKAAQNGPADPADVAKIGYEGLMKGAHHAIAGAAVQAQVLMSNLIPNEAVAAMARKQMEPADQLKKDN